MLNQAAYALGSARSCIRELSEYGRVRAQEIGEDRVFDFSLGNPSIPAPEAVREAILEILDTMDSRSIHGYTASNGDLGTRQALSRDLNCRYGAHTDPEEFFIGAGAAGELTAVLHALSVPEGEVLALAPYFPEYRPFTESAGLKFRAVPPKLPDFGIHFEALEAMLNGHTQALILNSPNNPTGVIYPRQDLQRLAALLEEKSRQAGHPIYLISDEPYRELAYGVEVPFVPALYRYTVVCYSYSKSLSLPGERIGYIYVPKAAGEELYPAICGAARGLGHVCAPSLWQQVIRRCAGLRPDLAAYDRNRKALYEGLTALGYECPRPDGAFYLFVKAPGGDGAAFSRRAKQHDVLVVPGEGFGCPGYVRLCYCVPHEKILASLPIFAALLEEEAPC